ncbi:DEAD/DEAH box helicase [Mycoplasma miroungirhinis]|uniref:ATP-binding protein n=1 Tax=Mycoplasma miroungirhinis TaxID=754516 RepID=A0A6M4JDE5_9MOLU|nr:DEAD/DEAH box helicase [Mycoplasma miroungirhinis]QJR44345.1 ATP-binding protein [Mycoplasma miroungirhinis]
MQKTRNYDFLLTNLLDINNSDSTLNFSIDNEKYFDVFKMSDYDTFDKLCKQHTFSVEFGEYGQKKLIKKIQQSRSKEEILQYYDEYSMNLPLEIQNRLNIDFENEKNKITSFLESRFQRSIIKWKKIKSKADNSIIEKNIWPLHLGFFFINVVTDKKDIFAPLFFKEVQIEIKNSLVYINSSSDVKVNAKLVTFLQSNGYSFDTSNFDFSSKSIDEIYSYFYNQWNKIYQIPASINTKIPSHKEINNHTTISIYSGLTLGLFEVSSGYLWNQMKKIIENDEIEEIFATDYDKNNYKKKIEDVIFKKNFGLYKIQQTNFSQDYATTSALYHDTIIWGPPGTGKSQTITNLIVNILARDLSAIIVSQKRAALEVIKNRLQDISIFGIFILQDRTMKLDTFYKPLQDFISKIENFNNIDGENYFKILSNEDKEIVERAGEIKSMPEYQNVLNAYSTMSQVNINSDLLESLNKLDKYITYNLHTYQTDYMSIVSALYTNNKGKKPTSFMKLTNSFPKNIKESAQIIADNLNLLHVDIDNAIKYIGTVSFENLQLVESFFKNSLKNKTIQLNDPKKLAKMLVQKTKEKIDNFNDIEKRQYREFAMSVRSAGKSPYKFFHEHKEMIKKLFSVIITTPDTDLSMWGKEEFDYAILDESSQIFLEKAIPILYLAKRKILAGDDKQMQPTKWFSASYAVEEDEDFKNIQSVLDYAQARGVYNVLLDKNYRSKKASLMTFSSKNFYDSKLDVVDDYKSKLKDTSIEVIQVEGTWNNSVNEKEADIALDIINEQISKYDTIIFLVFNSKQEIYIENQILSKYPNLEEAIANGNLTIKNIENVQGNEADLIVINVVYDKNTQLSATYVARPGGKNALNVAISRAKEKMIVIKSLKSEDIKISETSTDDIKILKEWLKFLELNENSKKNYIKNSKIDSWTETINLDISPSFLNEITETLNKEIIQKQSQLIIERDYSIGTKSINIAIINKYTNKLLLALMVDDYSYAGNKKLYLQFKDNILFLISKNYPLIVIEELDWKINKKNILNSIKDIVAQNTVEVVSEDLTKEIELQHAQKTVELNYDIYDIDESDDYIWNIDESLYEDINIKQEDIPVALNNLDNAITKEDLNNLFNNNDTNSQPNNNNNFEELNKLDNTHHFDDHSNIFESKNVSINNTQENNIFQNENLFTLDKQDQNTINDKINPNKSNDNFDTALLELQGLITNSNNQITNKTTNENIKQQSFDILNDNNQENTNFSFLFNDLHQEKEEPIHRTNNNDTLFEYDETKNIDNENIHDEFIDNEEPLFTEEKQNFLNPVEIFSSEENIDNKEEIIDDFLENDPFINTQNSLPLEQEQQTSNYDQPSENYNDLDDDYIESENNEN